LLLRFSTRVLHESLSDRCQACGGSKKQERTRTGAWVRPRGAMQRNAVFGVCRACEGTGRARPSHGERARWLKLAMKDYDDGRWKQRFSAAHVWIKRDLERRIIRPLTSELERRRKPV
jgi:hypothetical protein